MMLDRASFQSDDSSVASAVTLHIGLACDKVRMSVGVLVNLMRERQTFFSIIYREVIYGMDHSKLYLIVITSPFQQHTTTALYCGTEHA